METRVTVSTAQKNLTFIKNQVKDLLAEVEFEEIQMDAETRCQWVNVVDVISDVLDELADLPPQAAAFENGKDGLYRLIMMAVLPTLEMERNKADVTGSQN